MRRAALKARKCRLRCAETVLVSGGEQPLGLMRPTRSGPGRGDGIPGKLCQGDDRRWRRRFRRECFLNWPISVTPSMWPTSSSRPGWSKTSTSLQRSTPVAPAILISKKRNERFAEPTGGMFVAMRAGSKPSINSRTAYQPAFKLRSIDMIAVRTGGTGAYNVSKVEGIANRSCSPGSRSLTATARRAQSP